MRARAGDGGFSWLSVRLPAAHFVQPSHPVWSRSPGSQRPPRLRQRKHLGLRRAVTASPTHNEIKRRVCLDLESAIHELTRTFNHYRSSLCIWACTNGTRRPFPTLRRGAQTAQGMGSQCLADPSSRAVHHHSRDPRPGVAIPAVCGSPQHLPPHAASRNRDLDRLVRLPGRRVDAAGRLRELSLVIVLVRHV